mgnify:CR=1 FL=1
MSSDKDLASKLLPAGTNVAEAVTARYAMTLAAAGVENAEAIADAAFAGDTEAY